MRLAAIKPGDVVRLRDDPSLWLVRDVDSREVRLLIPRANVTARARPRQIVEHWRKLGKTRVLS